MSASVPFYTVCRFLCLFHCLMCFVCNEFCYVSWFSEIPVFTLLILRKYEKIANKCESTLLLT